MTTPIFSHVKDKNDMFSARDEDMIFFARRKILVETLLHTNVGTQIIIDNIIYKEILSTKF